MKKEPKKIKLSNSSVKESKYLLTIIKGMEIIEQSFQIQGHAENHDLQIVLLVKRSEQGMVDFFKEEIYKGLSHSNFAIRLSLVVNNVAMEMLVSNFKNMEQIEGVYNQIFCDQKFTHTDLLFFIDKNINEFQLQKYLKEFSELLCEE